MRRGRGEATPTSKPRPAHGVRMRRRGRQERGRGMATGGAAGAYTLGLANERLRLLEELEREIGVALQSAGTVILELSKEKPNERLLDRQASQFAASVQKVEAELSGQIRYLSQVATGQPHEGSSYSARKDCQMALNRVDYARVKLAELSRTCEQTLEQPSER